MKDYKIHLQYVGTARLKNEIWFSNLGFNGLFSMDINNSVLKYRNKIPFLEENVECAYANANLVYENKLFFFPNNCKEIMIYDAITDRFQKVTILPLDNDDVYITAGVIQWEKSVLIFPYKLEQGIFILDLTTLQLKHDIEFNKLLENFKNIFYFTKLDVTTIAVLTENNAIIELDIEKKKNIYFKQFNQNLDIIALAYNKNSYWLLLNKVTDIYEWNCVQEELIKYQLLEEEWLNEGGIPYSNIIFVDERIIVLNFYLKYIMEIDKNAHLIKKAVEYPKGFRFLDNKFRAWRAFAAFDVIDQKIWLHPVRGNMLLIYDIKENYLVGKEIVISTMEFPAALEGVEENILINNDIFCERDDMGGISGFIEVIGGKDYIKKQSQFLGNIVHKIIMDM